MFLWYKYLIVSFVFSHLGFWSGNLSLIAPFPDLCLLVPFFIRCDENKTEIFELLADKFILAQTYAQVIETKMNDVV